MKRAIILFSVLCLVSWRLAGLARAELVTIAIEGVVDSVVDPYGLLGGDIGIGDPITGTYTYDLSTPDSNPLAEGGDYEHRAPPAGIWLGVGGYEFITDPSNVNFLIECIDNDGGLDALLLVSYDNLFGLDGITFTNISWSLHDYTESALTNTSLPTTAPNMEDWDSNLLQFGGSNSDRRVPGMKGFNITGHITSAYVVPELATIFLLGAGVPAIRRRRRER